jgi:hypothetical protein
MAESKLSSFEAVVAAFTFVAIFALGYCHFRVSLRQDEQEARIERQREEFERSLQKALSDADEKRATDSLELQLLSLASPHLSRLRDSGPEAATSQRIVAAAGELLAARGRPALSLMVDRIREQSAPREENASAVASDPRPTIEASPNTPSNEWLVLLATLPGNELKVAEQVANDKLRVARDLGLEPPVSIYKTRLKGRYVVALGKPVARSAALAIADRARRANLAVDAFAEPDGGWELTGTAPFPAEAKSASIE